MLLLALHCWWLCILANAKTLPDNEAKYKNDNMKYIIEIYQFLFYPSAGICPKLPRQVQVVETIAVATTNVWVYWL